MFEEEKKIDGEYENAEDSENEDENIEIEAENLVTENTPEDIENDDVSIIEENLDDLLDEEDLEELMELSEELGLENDKPEGSTYSLNEEHDTEESGIVVDNSPENNVENLPENEVKIENLSTSEEITEEIQIISGESENETDLPKPDESQPNNEQISQDSLEISTDSIAEITEEIPIISEDSENETDLPKPDESQPNNEQISNDSSEISTDSNAELTSENDTTEGESITLPTIDPNSTKFKDLTEKEVKKNIIEAAMFIAGRPVSIEELSVKLGNSKKETEQLVYELAMTYMNRTSSIEIVQIGDSYSLQIKAEYTNSVKKFASGGLIPEAVMRTLTVIALKQPISKAKLVKMRGSGAYNHVKFLVDRGFLSSYKKGRSSILETTDQFSDQFGLSHDTKLLKQQLTEQLGIKSAEQIPPEQEGSTQGDNDQMGESLQTEE